MCFGCPSVHTTCIASCIHTTDCSLQATDSFEFNTLELSNALRCHGTWLSFLITLIAVALSINPPPERGVGRVLMWHEAVPELYLEFTQLLKAIVPNGWQTSRACHPVETNSLERSNALLCHGFWLSFLITLIAVALSRNPPPSLGLTAYLFGTMQ